MRIKRKNGLKIAAITIALLLCLALAVGITGAWYQAKRQATGTLSMDQGIIIDYKGFNGSETGSTWERGTTFELFSTKAGEVQPGAHIKVNAASIKANAESVNFYARVKLSYKFYNGETLLYDSNATTGNVEGFKPSDLITTSANFFGTNWVKSGDGYFYYATGTILNKFTTGQNFVDLFATDAKFVIEGAGFTGATSNGEGGGFVVGDTSINKIEVYLTLETLQGDADPAAEGWEIEPMPVIEDFSENKLLSSSGEVLDASTTTLIENTTYQVVDKEGNGYKFTYTLNEGNRTATITGPVGNPTELDIPSKIIYKAKQYTITSIGERAFNRCISLTSITIPDSVTSIGELVFFFCNSLEKIEVAQGNAKYSSVDSKGNQVNCLIDKDTNTLITGCKNSTIPEGVTSIGDNAFAHHMLTTITIPNSVKSIGYGAFYYCSLTSVTIGNSVKSIGYGAFQYCSSLTSVTIGNSVKTIGNYAFSGCRNLTKITIPDSVESIGHNAFEYCSNLTTIISDGWVTVSDNTPVAASTLLKDIFYDIKRGS